MFQGLPGGGRGGSMKQQSSLLDCSACPKLHGAAKCSAGMLGWDAPGGLEDEGSGAAAAAAGRICFLLDHRCRQINCLIGQHIMRQCELSLGEFHSTRASRPYHAA